MDWRSVAAGLFGDDHAIVADGDFLAGTATFDGATIALVGTTHHAEVGVDLALRQARAVLDIVENSPGRPLLLLVDTQGQKLRRRDELLGIHRAMAHLGCCLDLARRQGHPVIALVYDQALSGGFITSGLMADACHALPEAEIRVMRVPAMARVTKLSEQLLESLSLTNPVFAPGVANYVAMGGVRSLWEGDLAAGLRAALADRDVSDRRAEEGAQRGGRRVAADVIRRVLEA
ncbi:biotin-independent malonate decarboxylase subunit gamma [Scleromatobacter humisilvae]|uniref:Biotin-independent malonate decarboxylase subunit gamma n=1 Tax=Scleromatobacter humisilvae TaxID=2897159 RepID=A0A9X2C2Q5_9BURK|nr:biotin-independent malonate decarboxylase subunit gamma [Scleromatobacter humisilvae]MCK9689011.1 biotin-independent malonate decarboxylase subunit gamma [Scleromatobacter humisilvae]